MRFLVFFVVLLASTTAHAGSWGSTKYKLQVTVPDAWKVTETVSGLGLNIDESLFFGVSQVGAEQADRQLKHLIEAGAKPKKTKIAGHVAVRAILTDQGPKLPTIDLVLIELDDEQRLLLMAIGGAQGHKKHKSALAKVRKSVRKLKKSNVPVDKGFGDFQPIGKDLELKHSKFKISVPPSFVIEKRENGFVASGLSVVVDYTCSKTSKPEESTFEHKAGKKTLKGYAGSQGDGPGRRQLIQLFVAPKKGCTLELLSAGPPPNFSHELARQIMRSIR